MSNQVRCYKLNIKRKTNMRKWVCRTAAMAFFGRKEKRQEKTDFLCDDLSAPTRSIIETHIHRSDVNAALVVFGLEQQPICVQTKNRFKCIL